MGDGWGEGRGGRGGGCMRFTRVEALMGEETGREQTPQTDREEGSRPLTGAWLSGRPAPYTVLSKTLQSENLHHETHKANPYRTNPYKAKQCSMKHTLSHTHTHTHTHISAHALEIRRFH